MKIHRGLLGLALALSAIATLLVPLAARSKPDSSPASGGLDGSVGTMQPVNVQARIARVAFDPRSNGQEAWGLGTMRVPSNPEWGKGRSDGEQVVFMHFVRGRGWQLFGPPVDRSGAVANPVLANLAFAENGEAWAVGFDGALVHHTPGGGWVYERACGQGKALPDQECTSLTGISLRSSGGGVIGYAVGAPRTTSGAVSANTILALRDGRWRVDDRAIEHPSSVEFLAVTATGDEDAWAVGGASSRELLLFRREGLTWRRQRTGRPIFDNPAPSNDGTNINLTALGTAAGVAPDGTVWFGGGINPVNPDELENDSIPFTLRWKDGSFTSYCPPRYSVSDDKVNISNVCDSPMPSGPHDLTSLSVLPSGEVFAGGLGLFHFKNGVWWREPDAIGYLSSVTFASPTEGWVATTGNTIGGISAVSSANSGSITIGHYTANPEKPRSARWPQANSDPLHGIAIAPDGQRALAVGDNGAAVYYRPGIGWDKLDHGSNLSLRAVAWSGPNEAWAVGERGIMARFDGNKFVTTDIGSLTSNRTLNGLAFQGGRGYAVGADGVILTFASGRWDKDASSGKLMDKALFDVDFAGSQVIAVGENVEVLLNPGAQPGGWVRDRRAAARIGDHEVSLFSIDGLPDGSAFIGGSKRVSLGFEHGAMSTLAGPLDSEGSIMEISATRAQGSLEVFAAVSPEKLIGREKASAATSSLMHYRGGVWRDLDFSGYRTASVTPRLDSGATRDPVRAIAVEATGTSGWAVGGTPPNQPDEFGNSNYTASSSIYRFDLHRDPGPPGTRTQPVLPPARFRFAFFSGSSCGVGPCSITVGSGTTADRVSLAIRDEIETLSRDSDGPRFTIFGGDMRATGIVDELQQFKGFLSDFEKPVFAALGTKDLLTPRDGGLVGLIPNLPPEYRRLGLGDAPDARQSVTSNRPYLQSFANQFEPWGSGPQASGFVPVEGLPYDIRPADQSLARTHYAFDYAPGGTPLTRFIFIDTSDRLYSKGVQATQNQNPQQDQSGWLPRVVQDALSKSPPLPTIVVSNVPTLNPTTFVAEQKNNTVTDSVTLENALFAGGVSAVLSGSVRANGVYYYPDQASPKKIPFYVMGAAGAPLGGTKYPSDGHYHAWHLIDVDPSGTSIVDPQAQVKVHTIPVLESVAIHAINGLVAPGGGSLSFSGLGRAVDGGGPPGDDQQSRRTYIEFPTLGVCGHPGPDEGGCFAVSALRPDYHFISEDPSIAMFVKQGFGPGLPLVEQGYIVPDDQSGFLCTFKAGSTYVRLVSGTHQMRMPITVTAGDGPCVDFPVRVANIPPGTQRPPSVVPDQPPARPPLFRPPLLPEVLGVALPPPPGPVAAPAPPASAATSRKEEEEHQTQTEGQEDDSAQARVMLHSRQSFASDQAMAWLWAGTMAMMGLSAALAAGSIKQHRNKLNYARQRRR